MIIFIGYVTMIRNKTQYEIVPLGRMLDGAEEDGDGEEGVLVDDDLCDRRRERAGTRAIEEDVFCEVHILVDTPPPFDKAVNDIIFTCRTLDDGAPSHKRKNPRRVGEPRGGVGFFEVPREFRIRPFPCQVGTLRKERTYLDGRKQIV